VQNFLLTTQLYLSQNYAIDNAVPIWRLCDTWIQIFEWDQWQWCIKLVALGQWWQIDHLFYPNDWGWKWIKLFLISPYPPPLIGPYGFIAMVDNEYDLMTNRLRRWILKASPHAQIWRQTGINEIVKRHARIWHQIKINEIEERNQHHLTYTNPLLTWLNHILLYHSFPTHNFTKLKL
jgi:hypothetical protein